MSSSAPNSRRSDILTHVSTAIVVGFIAAVLYFSWEVLLQHRGRYGSLGQSLPHVFGVYAVAIVGDMILAGILFGIVSLVTGWLRSRSSQAALYSAVVCFGLTFLWHVRNWSVSRTLGVATSRDALVVLLLAAIAFAVGFVARRLAQRSGLRLHPGVPVTMVIVVVATFLLTQGRGHSVPHARRHAPDGPNVVMIVLDALRADHLSSYGYERDTSPNIDRLASEGALFLNAHSHGNRTILAMPALFTSLYPSFNGAISVGALMRPLPEDKTTIAEMLQARGYTTVALMTNIHLKSVFNMTQGFDRAEEFNAGAYSLSVYRLLISLNVLQRPEIAIEGRPRATEITDTALTWLDDLKDRPFFLYVHYMDTHHPYRPPPEFAEMFGGITTDPAALFMKSRRVLHRDPDASFDERDLQRLEDYYDASIRYADHEIGRLLDRVRDISKDRQTVVVVTADHGDEFLEHGTLYHNNLLIEELLHVPLIFWEPGEVKAGQRIDSLVRHIDVMPTLADMTGATVPDEAMGKSLLPLLTGSATDFDVPSFAEGDYCTSYVYDGWKVMYVDSTNQAVLYNLTEDPEERNNLADAEPERLRRMMAKLYDYRDRAADVRREMEATTDEETLRQLRALGYVN